MGDIGPVQERYEVLPVLEPALLPVLPVLPVQSVLPQSAVPRPEPDERTAPFPAGRRENWLTRTTRVLR